MSTPRRRIVRPPAPSPIPVPTLTSAKLVRLREALARDRAAFDRWLARLKRACRAVEKHQRRIARHEYCLRQAEVR